MADNLPETTDWPSAVPAAREATKKDDLIAGVDDFDIPKVKGSTVDTGQAIIRVENDVLAGCIPLYRIGKARCVRDYVGGRSGMVELDRLVVVGVFQVKVKQGRVFVYRCCNQPIAVGREGDRAPVSVVVEDLFPFAVAPDKAQVVIAVDKEQNRPCWGAVSRCPSANTWYL